MELSDLKKEDEKIEEKLGDKTEKPISKNQLKKQREHERWLKTKDERKAKKKAKLKEKKRLFREMKEKELMKSKKIKGNEGPENENTMSKITFSGSRAEDAKDVSLTDENKRKTVGPYKTKEELRDEFKSKAKNGLRVIIDLDFEHLMNNRLNNSMIRQVSDIYSVNRRSENPFRLILLQCGEQMKEGLTKFQYKNWAGVEVYFKEQIKSFEDFIKEVLYKKELESDNKLTLDQIKKKIYYLSPDSENIIKDLELDCSYIIGGLVDRNKFKNICLNKAIDLGLNHGKFPIDQYIQMSGCKVLTTNHTFHILQEYQKTKNWETAFMSIIPKRKQK